MSSNVKSVLCDKTGMRAKILKALQVNPDVTMDELSAIVKQKNKSNIWYHLHILEHRGQMVSKKVSVVMVVRRLREQADKLRAEGAQRPGRMSRKPRRSHLSEQELIEQVVAKAKAKEREGESVTGVDVMRVNRSSWSMKAVRIG